MKMKHIFKAILKHGLIYKKKHKGSKNSVTD